MRTKLPYKEPRLTDCHCRARLNLHTRGVVIISEIQCYSAMKANSMLRMPTAGSASTVVEGRDLHNVVTVRRTDGAVLGWRFGQ